MALIPPAPLLPQEDEELREARAAVAGPVQAMIDAAQAAGTLRRDVAFGDISLLIIRLARPLPAPISRDLDDQLAHRQLELMVAGLRSFNASSLPGPALTLADLRGLPAPTGEA